jgi:hypothetical protein
MTEFSIASFALMFFFAIFAGVFGALLGLGGGIIIIPVLTIFFRVPIKEAIATSLISVIATSTSAAVVYVDKHFSNVRLGMMLEIATTIGALIGGTLVVYLGSNILGFLFSGILLYTAYNMTLSARAERSSNDEAYIEVPHNADDDELAKHAENGLTPYTIHNYPAGMAASLAAGALSGLLGVGGGIIKVPVMRLVMRVPLRISIATSNFMIGVTAATGALLYYSRGMVNPVVTAPTVLGVLLGAQVGTRLIRRIKGAALSYIFVVVMLITAVQMILRSVHGGN